MAEPVAGRALPDLASIRGVLFDIDGTLTNSDPLHFAAFREILSEVGFQGGSPIDEAFFRARISGRHNPEIARDFFPDWSEEERVTFYTDKEQRFRDMAGSQLSRMPGLTEFLAWLEARGLRCGAVTNAPRDNTLLMLQSLGLGSRFECVVLGEECARAKPHPDPYLRGLELLGLQPHEAIIIEDSPSGVCAAVAAGEPVFGITSGQPASVLLEAGACGLIADFHQLVALARQQCAAAAAGSGDGDGDGSSKSGSAAAAAISLTADGRAG